MCILLVKKFMWENKDIQIIYIYIYSYIFISGIFNTNVEYFYIC